MNDMSAIQSKYIPGWVSSPPARHADILLQQISPSTSERKLNQKAILFGRVEKVCDVVLNHVSASRVHAVVAYDDAGTLQLADLGSTHGTFLDGERLGKNERRQLQLNDSVISFGLSPLRFKLIGTDPPKASAQAADAQAPTTGATCEAVTAEQEKLQGNQASLMHPASPLHGPSGGQQQPQQQQQQQQAVTQTTLQGSIAAPPAERHVVGEELDNRASSAAPLLQHPQADTAPLTAAEHSMVHTQEAGSLLPARDIVREEESDLQGSVAASQPDTACKPAPDPEQPPTSELPKPGEPPTAHANDHQGEVLTSQDGGLPDSKADKGQAGAMQQAHEGGSTRQGYSPCGRERSHAKSRHRHIAAKAVDVEDGKMPDVSSDGNTKALQTAADAVVREEPHPNAATTAAGPDGLRTSSGLAANSQHQAVHAGEKLDPKAATPGFASSKKPEEPQHSSSHKRPAAAPVGEELDKAANTSDSSPRHPKRQRGPNPAHLSSSGDPAAQAHGRRHPRADSTRSRRHASESSMRSSASPDHSLPLADDSGRQVSPGQQASGSKGLSRSPTHPQEDPNQHRHQQLSGSGSGSGRGHSSGSDAGSQPASARPLPSWRQQEQQEPEEEAEAEAVRAEARLRSQSRPFSRAGSRSHNSAQPGDPDGVAGVGPHRRSHRPHHGSPKAHLHQSTNGRGPRERSLGHSGAGVLSSAPDHRANHRANHRPDHRAAEHGADHRADHRIDRRADRRADHKAGCRADHRAQQPRSSGPSTSLDRADWQQPSHGGRRQDAGGYLPYGAHTHPDRQHPPHPQDIRDSRSSRHEADMVPDPRQIRPRHQPPQPPRRPFTRDSNTPRPHPGSAGHYQNRNTNRVAEDMTHSRGGFQHMGPPDACDADLLSHGPAASGRTPPSSHLTNDRPARGYSRPLNDEGHLHIYPDAERAQHGRSGSHGRSADRVPGSRARTDRPGYDDNERRAGSRGDMGFPPARLEARSQHSSESRPRHRQPQDDSGVMAPPRRDSNSHRPSSRASRDPPSQDEGRPRGDRSSRDHRDSGARQPRSHSRSRSRSRSTDRGSQKKKRKQSGFGGEPSAAPSSVAGDPYSAAAAVMRMQGHPTGMGLTLQQKKSKLWGSKTTPADAAQADISCGSNRWDTAAFASATDKEKFSRLMGVKKAGAPGEGMPDTEDREIFSKERQDQVLGDLESQFISGLRRKDGRTVGLGL